MENSANPPSNLSAPVIPERCSFSIIRLPAKAELMLLVSAFVREEDRRELAASRGSTKVAAGMSPGALASHRALAENRRHAHFRCDNRSKV